MNPFLIELFLYYARFVSSAAVEPLFNKGKSEIPGYQELQQQIASDSSVLIQEIDNYIFSSNFEAVQSAVARVNGFYLFVDYGEISSTTDRTNSNVETARMAITVAYRLKDYSGDLMEQLLVSSKCLELLVRIRNSMLREQQKTPWLKDLSKTHEIVPFGRNDLSSIGWSMLFERKTYDLFNAKLRI